MNSNEQSLCQSVWAFNKSDKKKVVLWNIKELMKIRYAVL